MLYFLFFILGVAFTQYVTPLLNSLVEIILTKLEVIKGKYALQATETTLEIEKLVNDNEESGPQQPAIGFQYISEEELDDI